MATPKFHRASEEFLVNTPKCVTSYGYFCGRLPLYPGFPGSRHTMPLRSSLTVVRRYPPSSEVIPHRGVYSHRRKYPTLRSAVARARAWARDLYPSAACLAACLTARSRGYPRESSVPFALPRKDATPYAPRSDRLDSTLKLQSGVSIPASFAILSFHSEQSP